MGQEKREWKQWSRRKLPTCLLILEAGGFTARFCKGQLAEAEQMAEGMREGGGREVMISGPYSSVSPGLGKAGSV